MRGENPEASSIKIDERGLAGNAMQWKLREHPLTRFLDMSLAVKIVDKTPTI